MEPPKNIATVRDLLLWSYANLAMAHAAVSDGSEEYGRTHFAIRSRLYKGLSKDSMHLGPLADDERLKMVLPQSCCYCGSTESLAADHLIPLKKGGANTGDNLVWACRKCNSSNGATDALEWMARRQQFPPLLLLRRYLKLAIELSHERGIMDAGIHGAPELPFSLAAIPTSFPQPKTLRLWVTELPSGVDGKKSR